MFIVYLMPVFWLERKILRDRCRGSEGGRRRQAGRQACFQGKMSKNAIIS